VPTVAIAERFAQDAQIDQLESFYEEAITMNGAAEPVKSKPKVRMAPQFAEGLPANSPWPRILFVIR